VSKRNFLKRFLKEYHWLLIGMIWIVAYVLGYIGSIKQFAATAEERSFWDPFYRPLQLFLMDDSMVVLGPVMSWELEVARFLAPAVAAYTALIALLTLFRDQIKVFRLRFVKGHTVICGLGQKGLQFVKDFNNHGDQVVVIEVNEDNDEISSCRELGIPVLIGDATDELLLRKARVHCAGYVIAITGDDGTNIEIAMLTHRLVEKRKASLVAIVQCFVHIVDFKLCTLLGRHRIFTNTEDAFEISVFNVYEDSARVMLKEHPLDRDGISTEDRRDIHLIVAGFGQMGESIVLQAARIAHFANDNKLRITVIDKIADEKRKSFYGRYPQFDKACEMTFLNGDVEDIEILNKICQWANDGKNIMTAVVTFDNDARSLSCALNIMSRLLDHPIPIAVRLNEDNGLGLLLENNVKRSSQLNDIYSFGMISLICTREILVNEKLNLLAKAIHADYISKAKADGRPDGDLSIQPWEQLHPDLKNSNLQQADHIPVKLRAINCYSSYSELAKNSIMTFTDEEVEVMAKMEHARWNAERFLAGWVAGPKNIEKKTSPYLVPWEELPEGIKEYDRNTVRKIPYQLSLIGMAIYR
jgi:voltage-gated potassium channel Kch